ncbi:MAG TPA: FMN-binding protein [Micromonospora sp.]
MRRAVMALLGTTIGTTVLVGAKLGTPAPAGSADVAADPADSGAPVPAESGVPTASAPPGATDGPAVTPSGSARPTTSAKATPSSGTRTSSAPRPASGGLRDGTFAGAAYTHEHGTVKVTITVSGGRMTNVTATYPTSPARAASINNDAIPKLRQEALAAQSARIATVSGATLTSGAYRNSLQSALDRAGA